MLRSFSGMRGSAGFSLFELMIVIGIGVLISAITLPRMTTVIANMKLRSSMTTLSGFLQNVRMLAIHRNQTVTARHFNRTETPFSLVYYAKQAADTSGMTTADSQVEMEAPISAFDAPTGPGAPPVISNSEMGVTVTPESGDPSFNSRGLPCAYSGGTCANVAFIKYFRDNRIADGGWAAISVTSAGRIKRWFWNGSNWTD
jgi:Tfp pilus assembly protein FimT